MRLCLSVWICIFALSSVAAAAPWQRRRRKGIHANRRANVLVDHQDWPAEPSAPAEVDPERFATALDELCGGLNPAARKLYPQWILQYAAEFQVDPFLLGALVQRMGRCRADAADLDGVGLTLLSTRLYSAHYDKASRSYRYWVRDGESWAQRVQSLDRFPFSAYRLRFAEANLYFAAAFLSIWREQHEALDATFEQVPHRHYVSHFVWGDRVGSGRAEDRILLDRRRLLEYYGAIERLGPVEAHGVQFSSPLDGGLRVVSSFIGDPRARGRRAHRGLDLESVRGEPVRAIADGRVDFAGVDLPGRGKNKPYPRGKRVRRWRMGAGGRFICIRHPRPEQSSLRSCYMHLKEIHVRRGDQVKRGQLIGQVGRTGIKRSAPHLHFEIRDDRGILDPAEVLTGLLVGRSPDPPRLRRRRRVRAGLARAR